MTDPSADDVSERVPSVLAVLVVRDAIGWLRETLSTLAAQTYGRVGVLAIDNASTDGSNELLAKALGQRRVVTLDADRGLAGSFQAALEVPAARGADYLFVLHDDVALDRDAVARLVEAAEGIRGVEDVGVVGPKVVDWDDPRLLLDVGRSADRFGHPYTPLQTGEIDQGQFDRVLEVLCVSSCAMLISKDVWQQVGVFDERLDAGHEELDFCWRARLAGFRVLMTPLARVRHRRAESRGERAREKHSRSKRYFEDRAAIASMLKNYKLLSLLWLVPLDIGLGVGRLAYLVFSRRLEEAFDLLAGWGWNVLHLPGTLARRVRAQSVRRVSDRSLRRFMESAGLRLPRWFETAGRILDEQHEIDEEDEDVSVTRRLRDRTASLVGSHPVVVGGFVAAIVAGVAFRALVGPESLHGGVLPAFPPTAGGFFTELGSAFRTTGLGGTLSASPALGLMGGLSWIAFGSPAVAQKLMLGAAPILAGLLMYRAAVRLTGRPAAAVAAAGAYGLSAVVLWAFSQGRIGLLVVAAILPALIERTETAFSRDGPVGGRWRFVAGVGVTIAVGVAFEPGVALALGVVVLVQVLAGSARLRGLALLLVAALTAAILLFPFVPTILAGGGATMGSLVGTTDLAHLGRLALGSGPGTWVMAAFLPVAAILGLALVGQEYRSVSVRAATVAVAALALAWFSGAGYLPKTVANAPIYVALAAVSEALIIAFGVASVLSELGREAFGLRQIGTALLALALGAGFLLQSASAMVGGWAIGGPEAVPPAWAIVSSRNPDDYRVLWLGRDDGRPFVAPGGDPAAVAEVGLASVRYSLTGRDGSTALDTGRSISGPGARYASRVLVEILSGTTVHGGALLAPLGVRFVVANAGDLPAAAAAAFDAQVDMNLDPAVGLVIYRNAAALPPVGVVAPTHGVGQTAASADLATISTLPSGSAVPLTVIPGGWAGTSPEPGLLLASTEFSSEWRLDAGSTSVAPRQSFGWATSFEAPAGALHVRFAGQWVRNLEMLALALLWASALWITRRPVPR